jgi:hypothetical protein
MKHGTSAGGVLTAPIPDVRVKVKHGFVAGHPWDYLGEAPKPQKSVLFIAVENHSPSPVFIRQLQFELEGGERLVPTKDFLGRPVPGDVTIEPRSKHEILVLAEDYVRWLDRLVCGVALDQVDHAFRSSPEAMPAVIRQVKEDLARR